MFAPEMFVPVRFDLGRRLTERRRGSNGLGNALGFGPAFPQQALLGHRGDQGSVAREDEAARKSARTRQIGTILGVQEPLVGAARAMEPERVIEATSGS